MAIRKDFWKNKRVLITGHTGFKGSWLTIWLKSLGADLVGYALPPRTKPSIFEACNLNKHIHCIEGDIRDLHKITEVFKSFNPEIVVHMAAQPLVRRSYEEPIETFSTNIMGTANILEALRVSPSTKAFLNVTTDKCYKNKETSYGYNEFDELGGFDPYSSSKACSELITSSYRDSFFNQSNFEHNGVALATARAGNVIGGGDWSEDRLIPDIIRSIQSSEPIKIRNPESIRPWQHVLDPLHGYIILLENLYLFGDRFSGAWNFGPNSIDTKSVLWILNKIKENRFFSNINWIATEDSLKHETKILSLDCTKAINRLFWKPKLNLKEALKRISEWHEFFNHNQNILEFTIEQITDFENLQ